MEVPGLLGAKLGNFELGGGGPMYAIVYPEFYFQNMFGFISAPWVLPPNSNFPKLAPNGPGTPNIGFLGSVS